MGRTPHGGGKVSKLMVRPMKIFDRIKMGLGITLVTALTGCVGYVDGGGGGAVVVAPGPDVVVYGGGGWYGGDFGRGRATRDAYSDRGSRSRQVAHPSRGGEERKR